MHISSLHETLRCSLVVALLMNAMPSAIAQSTVDSPRMLGGTARQMLTAQRISTPDFVVRAPYVGIGAGASSLDPDTSMVSDLDLSDGEQAGVQLTIGMDFSEWFSGEFHVAELGEAELSDNTSVNYREFGLSALMYLGPNRDRFNRRGFNVFARAGLGYLENGVSEGAAYRQEEAGQWILGAGAEFSTSFGLGLRAEGLVYDSDVTYFQLGLLYRFAKMPGGVSGIADLGVSSVARAELAKLEAARVEAARAEAAEAEAARAAAEAQVAEAAQAEAALADAAAAEKARVEAEIAEAARAKEALADAARAEAAEAETARAEAAEAETARAEAELAEAARAESERAEAAATEAARAEAAALAEATRVEAAAQAARAEEEAANTANADAENLELNGVVEGLTFFAGSADLTDAGARVLDSVVAALLDAPRTKARLNTHTNNVLGVETSLRLSQQRVISIARYLVQKGVSKNRLEARAFGQSRPIDTNATDEGRDNNDRVEIFLMEP